MTETTAARKESAALGARKIAEFGLIWLAVFLPVSMAGISTMVSIAIAGGLAAFMLRSLRFSRTPLDIGILIFLVGSLATALLTPSIARGLKGFTSNYIVLIVPVIYAFYEEEGFFEKLWGILVAVGGAISIYTIIQWFTGIDIPSYFGKSALRLDHSGNYFLGIGMFDHHLTFGNQIMMIMLIAVGAWFEKPGAKKIYYTISILLMTAALGFSYSRGPWLGTIAALFLGGLIKGKRYAITLTIAGVIAFSAIFAASPQLRNRFTSIFSFEKNKDRLLIWQTSLELLADNPITGIGYGQYRDRIIPYQQKYDHKFTSQSHSHNAFLHVAVVGGLVFFIPFVILWLLIFRELYRLWRRQSAGGNGYDLGLFMAVIGFVVAGLFQCNFQDAENVVMLWLLLGQITARNHHPRAVGAGAVRI